MEQRESSDRVTISFYGTESAIEKSLSAAIDQIPNIINIKKKLSDAAVKTGRSPPEIVLSILIIPDWEHGSSYEEEQYNKTRTHYFSEFKKNLEKHNELNDIIVDDFYAKHNLHRAERDYLQHLEAKGSNADMIKTHAIIENKDRRHLQMDSNTKIFDFDELYRETFGMNNQQDALNASYYDDKNHYVSAHNKIVYTATYTTPSGRIASELEKVHLAYCDAHKDDHKQEDTKAEKKEKNSIYSKDFVVALEHLGLTGKKTIHPTPDTSKDIYFATLDKPEYRITKCVATAVNMSWRGNNTELEKLKKLPSVTIGDAECDYTCFANAAAKHVDILDNQGVDLYDDTAAHRQLMGISNQAKEKEMIKAFVEQVARTHVDMLEPVISSMHPNTERGKTLFQELFRCNSVEFIQQAKRMVEEEERFRTHDTKRAKGSSETGCKEESPIFSKKDDPDDESRKHEKKHQPSQSSLEPSDSSSQMQKSSSHSENTGSVSHTGSTSHSDVREELSNLSAHYGAGLGRHKDWDKLEQDKKPEPQPEKPIVIEHFQSVQAKNEQPQAKEDTSSEEKNSDLKTGGKRRFGI